MKLNKVVLKTLVASLSLMTVTTAVASNPFKRPEIKAVEDPIYQNPDYNVPHNPYDQAVSLEVPDPYPEQVVGNPLLQKESVIFKGSINGVDIYFDKATGQYIQDKAELETVNLLTSSLPELEKVNY